MATSGTTTWNLTVAEIVETAAKRARPASMGPLAAKDAKDARIALNLVLIDLQNAGHSLNKIEYKTLSLGQGTTSYTLPVDVLDIFDAVWSKYDSATGLYTDYSLTRIDLAAYNQINDKALESTPSQFALHRGLSTATLYLYPTSASDTDKINYWAFTKIEDISAANEDVDLPQRYLNVLISGLAHYMAMEIPEVPEDKLARLEKHYEDAVELAFGEDRDRSSFFITP